VPSVKLSFPHSKCGDDVFQYSSRLVHYATCFYLPRYQASFLVLSRCAWSCGTDACTTSGLYPSHDAPGSLFSRALPAPGNEAGVIITLPMVRGCSVCAQSRVYTFT